MSDQPDLGCSEMNIQERLAEALLETNGECIRCGTNPTVVRIDVFGKTGKLFARSRLCRACHTDFCWFMVTQPEMPEQPEQQDVSSDTMDRTEEASNDEPTTT